MKTKTIETVKRASKKFIQSGLYKSSTGVILVASKTSDLLYGTVIGYTASCPEHMKTTFPIGHTNSGDCWNSNIFSPFIGTVELTSEASDF